MNDKEIIFKCVQSAIKSIGCRNKTREQMVALVAEKVRRDILFDPFRQTTYFDSYKKPNKLKQFVKSKYWKIGIPSKEKIMLKKMIIASLDDLDFNESNINSLSSTISQMELIAIEAEDINKSSDQVVDSLNKISASLEE